MKTSDKGARLIDLMSHALVAKLVAVIADDADESVLKAALSEYPAIVSEIMEDLVARFVEARDGLVEE